MNKTGHYLTKERKNISIYFTADYPEKGSTIPLVLGLQNSGADCIEIGIPFSDPLADGPVIQHSSMKAIENGFLINELFQDLESILPSIKIPIVLMGYLNSLLSFGLNQFLERCHDLHIDTLIIPDLPVDIYESNYQSLFNEFGVSPVFLITPNTSVARIRRIDGLSNAFIYAVSDNNITGNEKIISTKQLEYFERIKSFPFSVPVMIGFGISSKEDFDTACKYANGAIIGSAFIKSLLDNKSIAETTNKFLSTFQ